jgi:phage gp36-like protein
MAYITVQYIEDRVREQLLIELTDDSESPTGAIVETKISNAIAYIEARLNNVLRKTYTVPLVSNDSVAYADSLEVIQGLVMKCVIFQLYVQALRPIDSIPPEYIDAITELTDYESGKQVFTLYGFSPKTTNITNLFVSNKTADDIVFDSDLWDKF